MKEKIIRFNKQFGLETEFFTDSDVLGYSIGNTIYLNANADDIEKINKHELFHFFEEDELFLMLKKVLIEKIKDNIDSIRKDYYLRYYGIYTEEEIQMGILDTEIVIDFIIENYEMVFENGLKIGDYVLREITKNIDRKNI